MKKLLCLMMAAVFAGTLLTGCGTKTVKAPEATTAPAVQDNSFTYIQNKKELIVGLDDTFAPMGFRDDKGEIVGFDVDFAKAVGEKLGVKVTFQPIDWDAKEMELSGKKIDVIWNGLSITPERQKTMLLTKPYLNNTLVIMTKAGSSIKTKADLKGKKIATQAGSSGLKVIEADAIYPEIKDKLVEYKSYDEAVMDLDIGRVQAIVIDKVLGKYKASKKQGVYAFADQDFGEDLYAVALRKEDKAFAEKLQSAMDALKADGTATKISKTWFGEDIVVK